MNRTLIPKFKILNFGGILISIFAIFLAFLVGAMIMLFSGVSPLEAYYSLFAGAFGGWINFADTLFAATPLMLTGLATAISFRSGVFNIGVEGSLYLGAFASAWVGFTFTNLPSFVVIPFSLIFSMVIGGIWGYIPAILKVKLKVDEIVSTIMLNYVAILFTSYLVNYPFQVPGVANSMSERISKNAELPRLMRGSQLNLSFFIALALILIFYIVNSRTKFGYESKVCGKNMHFAEASGIDVDKIIITSMVLSGAIGGLVGALQILGVYYRFYDFFSPGYGFDGIPIAILSNNHPIGCLFVAILFGALRSGGSMMELMTGIPIDLSNVLEAMIIFFVTAKIILIFRKSRKGEVV